MRGDGRRLRRLVGGVLAVAALVAVGVVISRLPDAGAPASDGSLELSSIDAGRTGTEVITCERTLPDEPVIPEGVEPGDVADTLEPVGRITSSEVVECPDLFDGRVVTYVGEVVGDVLERDGGAWTLMNDDAYALEVGPLSAHDRFRGYNSGLSVWLDGRLAGLADEPGRAGRRGDVLRVRGIVHRVDPAAGGGLTLRAFDGELVADAEPVSRPVNVPQAVVAGVLAVLALGVLALERLGSGS